MKYGDLVHQVKRYSGMSEQESEDALQLLVESLAVHLTEQERMEFAQQLPEQLGDMALSVMATKTNVRETILEQFMRYQKVGHQKAIEEINSAWRALKSTLSPSEIQSIRTQLRRDMAALLT